MIAGFEQPTTGRILLDGKDVSRVPPYRRNVNTVFQHYALFPHMTVADNVAFGPRSQKVGAEETRAPGGASCWTWCGSRSSPTGSRRSSPAGSSSAWRWPARSPTIPSALLLDEPLGALDLKLRQAMQIELKRIQREVGITFIYVTHDQEEALTMSDRIAVMNEGRVEQIGTPQEIYHSPTLGLRGQLHRRRQPDPGGRAARGGAGRHGVGRRAPPGAGAGGRPADPPGRRGHASWCGPSGSGSPPTAPTDGAGVPVTVEHAVFQGPVVRCTLRRGRRQRDRGARGAGAAAADAAAGPGAVGRVGHGRGAPPAAGRRSPEAPVDDEPDLRHTVERRDRLTADAIHPTNRHPAGAYR